VSKELEPCFRKNYGLFLNIRNSNALMGRTLKTGTMIINQKIAKTMLKRKFQRSFTVHAPNVPLTKKY